MNSTWEIVMTSAGFILTLAIYGFCFARWVLAVIKDHADEDHAAFKELHLALEVIKERRIQLQDEVTELAAQIEAMPNRDTLDALFDRIEVRFTKQIEQLEGRVTKQSENLETRLGNRLDKMSDAIATIVQMRGRGEI
jgi:hypothetical protein